MRKENRQYFLFYLIYWFSVACLAPYLGLVYLQRGLSGTQIGIINSISALITIPASLIAGSRADKSNHPNLVLTCLALGAIVSVGVMYLVQGIFSLTIVTVFYGFFTSPTGDIADNLLMQRIREKPSSFGKYRLGGSLGYMVGAFVSGMILHFYSIQILFAIFIVGMVVVLMVTIRMPVNANNYYEKNSLRKIVSITTNKSALIAVITLVIWGLTESGVMQFLSLHILSNGYPPEYTSAIIMTAMVGEFIFFAIVPAIIRKIDPINTIAVGFAIQMMRLVSLSMVSVLPLPITILTQFVGGGAFSLVYAAGTQFIKETFDDSVSFTAQSLKTLASRGIGVVVGALLFGFLYDKYSTNTAFISVAGIAFLYSILMLLYGANVRKNIKDRE